LHDWPVAEDIGRKVDFMLCGVDQRHVDMFKIFGWRVVDCRRVIGAALWANGEDNGD